MSAYPKPKFAYNMRVHPEEVSVQELTDAYADMIKFLAGFELDGIYFVNGFTLKQPDFILPGPFAGPNYILQSDYDSMYAHDNLVQDYQRTSVPYGGAADGFEVSDPLNTSSLTQATKLEQQYGIDWT